MLTLNLPQHRDPVVRIVLIIMFGAVLWVNTVKIETPALAQSGVGDYLIIDATPTPALPTPAPGELPGAALAVATPTPAPGWIDQTLAAVSDAGDQFAADQAAALAHEQAAAEAKAAADHAQYLANVGAQAPHSPRGDIPAPPQAFVPGMVAQPVNADNEIIIIDPKPADPLEGFAAAVPAISPAQAAVLSERESNGCAAGQLFYPRSGCHTPGSGGDMPGAVRP